MQTLSGEVFVTRYDSDLSKWVGHSGKPINCPNAQHYLQWASQSLGAQPVDAVLVELHPIGFILRVGENESQPVDICVKAMREAETGLPTTEIAKPTAVIDTDTQAYREVADWLANNYRLVLWKTWRCARKYHVSSTRDSAQEVTRWILQHANDHDPSRSPVEAFCRAMLNFRLRVITRNYVVKTTEAIGSQLEGDVQVNREITGTLSEALPPNTNPMDRWLLETYAQGYTYEEIGRACNPPISKVTVHKRIQRAIIAVQEHYQDAGELENVENVDLR